MPTTLSPLARSALTQWLPMNPAAPVTRMVLDNPSP